MSASCQLSIHAVPNARTTQWVGRHGGALKIKVAAPPEDGRANKELQAYLCEVLGVRKGAVALLRGASSREKVFSVDGLTEAEAVARLEASVTR